MAELNNPLFSEQELEDMKDGLFSITEKKGPVTVLGKTFSNDEERLKYFQEELRKKLPELKYVDGFPNASDEDIIKLSNPPYYTACPNPWLNEFIHYWEEEKIDLLKENKREDNFVVSEPYAADVSEGKNNPIYNAHTYHTKVPHPAIIKYIQHYTQPGDIILDGFCGTGMTGVAAHLAGSNPMIPGEIIGHRNCICSDISVISTLIAGNYNKSISGNQFRQEAQQIFDTVYDECSWMYKTAHKPGVYGDIEYVVWSDVFICPNCGEEIVFYEAACDKQNGKVADTFSCPHCNAQMTKRGLTRAKDTKFDDVLGMPVELAKTTPVLIKYKYQNKFYTKPLDDEDKSIISRIDSMSIPYWVPTTELSDGCKTFEPKRTNGLRYTHQFYTKRNQYILSSIYDKIGDRTYLKIWFTSQLINISKQNRYRPEVSFPYNPLNGTLYVGSLVCESNVFVAYKNKIDKIANAYRLLNSNSNVTCIQSATALQLKDNSIDYIFIDPPFGANIMYSELNELWENWLRITTNNTNEAIINSVQNKGLSEYSSLLISSMREYYRVLKPGKWMTIEFSNTKASVWNSIQTALQAAGFIVVNVSSLDKQQGSYNAVTSTTAVKQDLVVTCYKPLTQFVNRFLNDTTIENVWEFVDSYLSHLPIVHRKDNKVADVMERTPKILYDKLVSFYVQKGLSVPIDATDFQYGLKERYIDRNGLYFNAIQAVEYDNLKSSPIEFIPLGLIVGNEADGIEWLKIHLHTPKTYAEIQPDWLQAINGVRKGDILPELNELLDENFIQESDGRWRLPNIQDDVDKFKLRTKSLLKEFKLYVEQASKPKGKLKEVRVEAVRAGFKQCYIDKDFRTIVTVGDKIPQNLLEEDEILLQFYDIAVNHI